MQNLPCCIIARHLLIEKSPLLCCVSKVRAELLDSHFATTLVYCVASVNGLLSHMVTLTFLQSGILAEVIFLKQCLGKRLNNFYTASYSCCHNRLFTCSSPNLHTFWFLKKKKCFCCILMMFAIMNQVVTLQFLTKQWKVLKRLREKSVMTNWPLTIRYIVHPSNQSSVTHQAVVYSSWSEVLPFRHVYIFTGSSWST